MRDVKFDQGSNCRPANDGNVVDAAEKKLHLNEAMRSAVKIRPPWTIEILNKVESLWWNGKPASVICGEIPIDVSRNAVMGQIHRRGFERSGSAAVKKPKPTKSKLKKPRVQKLRPTPKRPRPVKKPPKPTENINQLSLTENTRVGMGELAAHHCQFIVTGEGVNAVFCGRVKDEAAETSTRKQYCPEHGTIVTVGSAKRWKRDPAKRFKLERVGGY